MPQATFYTHVADSAAFAVRLTQRALQNGRVLVWAADEEALHRLDHIFWAFAPESFLAHEVWLRHEPYPQDVALVLAAGYLPETLAEGITVLNLSPDFWCEAAKPPQRVLEIVSDNLDDLAEARIRFSAYKKSGFAIDHHTMAGKA